MPVVLHKLDPSPPARAALMTVEILGLNVETKDVNVLNKEQYNPEYLAKNPLHTIPLLEDGDFALADSHAIMTYLVSKYGADKREQLYPNDLRERALINQRLFMDATILFPRLRAAFIELKLKQSKKLTEQQIADIEEAYGFLETYLNSSPYLVGDSVTLADVSCVSTVSSLNAIHAIGDKYLNVTNWLQQLEKEKWYKKANEPGLAIFTAHMNELKS